MVSLDDIKLESGILAAAQENSEQLDNRDELDEEPLMEKIEREYSSQCAFLKYHVHWIYSKA